MEGLNAFEYLSSSGETRKFKKIEFEKRRNIFFQKNNWIWFESDKTSEQIKEPSRGLFNRRFNPKKIKWEVKWKLETSKKNIF